MLHGVVDAAFGAFTAGLAFLLKMLIALTIK
jgi:hypothetical protein